MLIYPAKRFLALRLSVYPCLLAGLSNEIVSEIWKWNRSEQAAIDNDGVTVHEAYSCGRLGSILDRTPLRSYLGQVNHTCMPLSPNSIIWDGPKGGDARRLVG